VASLKSLKDLPKGNQGLDKYEAQEILGILDWTQASKGTSYDGWWEYLQDTVTLKDTSSNYD
jgi:hypothetical protein